LSSSEQNAPFVLHLDSTACCCCAAGIRYTDWHISRSRNR